MPASDGSPIPFLNLTLHPEGVASPAQRAAAVCREIVDLYFDALAKADLSKPPPEGQATFFRFRITTEALSAGERRSLHENWLLAKAFQDLMRGVLISLREAHLFIEILSAGKFQAKTDMTLDEVLEPFRERARRMKFPDLLTSVNKRLSEPLVFADAYQSMQDARNCLEHAEGIVGIRDVNADGVLKLRFPRIKFFTMKDAEEIEMYENFYAEAETAIMFRLDVRERTFKLGERLAIGASDFDDIAFACWQFGTMLAARLPKSPQGEAVPI